MKILPCMTAIVNKKSIAHFNLPNTKVDTCDSVEMK